MSSRQPRTILILTIIFVVASVAIAQEHAEAPIATVRVEAGQITFEPLAGKGWVNVRVTGPGEYAFTAAFPPGQLPIFRAMDPDGNPLPDGSYNYEIDEVPQNGKIRTDDDSHGLPEKSQGKAKLFQTQFGHFTVLNGSIVSPTLEEGESATKGGTTMTTNATVPDTGVAVQDQVIPDDLIVQGSVCVGFDCVNNEAFGFDTIRLKENNTRIKFEDTSSSAGFPSTDWQLTANDSASGGQNKFSIEDITGARVPFTVEGASPTNSLYIDSSGKVGFRTSTPVLDLHVLTGNTPGIRLDQNGSNGFTAQIWDIAGNEANFFVRDVTGGSRLPFRIRPGAPTSSLDIAADGDVGFGTASPTRKITLADSAEPDLGFSQRISGTETEVAVLRATAARLRLEHGGVNTMSLSSGQVIFPTGPVGIGTAVPSSSLHVHGGDIRVSNGSFIDDGVSLNVPDYVFEPAYQLMPISELARFIRDNKHLPNIPNAAEVKAKGLNLSQMQMGLLEKVEELTLYSIEQHETINSLKSQNDELMKRLTALEEKLASQQ